MPVDPHGLTYSDDNGETWNIDNQFNNPEDGGSESAIVYNLYYHSEDDECSTIYASTNQGLYSKYTCFETSMSDSWQIIEIPSQCFDDTQSVYSFFGYGFDQSLYPSFVGTSNGLIYECESNGCAEGWCNDEYVNTEILENLQFKINLNIKEDASIEVVENG